MKETRERRQGVHRGSMLPTEHPPTDGWMAPNGEGLLEWVGSGKGPQNGIQSGGGLEAPAHSEGLPPCRTRP